MNSREVSRNAFGPGKEFQEEASVTEVGKIDSS